MQLGFTENSGFHPISQFSSAYITKNEMQEQNQDHPVKALYWDIHLG